MQPRVEFETPENVLVSYPPAGLGTRFIAWFVDQIFVSVLLVLLFIIVIIGGLHMVEILQDFLKSINAGPSGKEHSLGLYVFGIFILMVGLSNFFYYGLSEYLMRGQTIGKRLASIRVVKVDGFSLDAGSVLIRNLFRVVDHIPVVWIVPFLSEKTQRLGDMVAGTVVVVDEAPKMSHLREELLQRPPELAAFRFDAVTLRRALPSEIDVVEKILDRYASLPEQEKETLLGKVCEPLARRLKIEPPSPEQRFTFLTDFLAAELRRQHRELG
jgi:uncharacterized RDD family membrane protein YckC